MVHERLCACVRVCVRACVRVCTCALSSHFAVVSFIFCLPFTLDKVSNCQLQRVAVKDSPTGHSLPSNLFASSNSPCHPHPHPHPHSSPPPTNPGLRWSTMLSAEPPVPGPGFHHSFLLSPTLSLHLPISASQYANETM